jgi:plastocyanin
VTSIARSRVAFWAVLALCVCCQTGIRAADFILADDFESAPDCSGVTTPGIAVSASPASHSMILGTQHRLLIKLRSCGYAGSVTLSVNGTAASWGTAFDPPILVLANNAAAESALSIQIPTDGDAGAFAVQVSAQGSAATGSASAILNVLKQVIVPFADGTGGGDHNFPPILVVKLGTMVRFVNYDSTSAHQIHAAHPDEGFPHGTGDIFFGGEFDVTPNSPGTYDYYCHDHMVAAGSGEVIVQ